MEPGGENNVAEGKTRGDIHDSPPDNMQPHNSHGLSAVDGSITHHWESANIVPEMALTNVSDNARA